MKIEYLKTVDSTNEYLINKIVRENIHQQVVIAEQQTAGRGRSSNHWQSPRGNIYFSLGWQFAVDINLSGLSLVVGISCVEALNEQLGIKLQLKWPNDIFFAGKKLGGILVELNSIDSGNICAVIGIGININSVDLNSNRYNAIGLKHITDKQLSNNLIVENILSYLQKNIDQFKLSGFKPFQQQWQNYDYLLGKFIKVDKISGFAHGVNNEGALLVAEANKGKDSNSVVCAVISGSVEILAVRENLVL